MASVRNTPLATDNLLENTDGVLRPQHCSLGTAACDLLVMLTRAILIHDVIVSKAEFTVCRLGDDDFYVAGSRDAMNQDLRLLNDGPADPTVTNCSPEVEIVHIAGPNSYKVLEKLNPEVLEIPFLNMREMEIAGVHCKLFRISFSGCLGYELHCSVDDCPKLYSAIAEAGEEFQMGRFGSYVNQFIGFHRESDRER